MSAATESWTQVENTSVKSKHVEQVAFWKLKIWGLYFTKTPMHNISENVIGEQTVIEGCTASGKTVEDGEGLGVF